MSSSDTRDKSMYLAKIAEQAERYDEMAGYMRAVGGSVLSDEERNLLSAAYKNAIGSRRAAWRVITSVAQKEASKGNVEHAALARVYCRKLEAELQTICDDILELLADLIPRASGGESRVFYHKMRADYYRYIAEFTEGDKKSEAAETARGAYEEVFAIVAADLAVTHPIRLGMALSYSVFQYEVLQNPEEARRMARSAFEAALAELDSLGEESYRDATLIMQLLREKLTLWTSDEGQEA